MLVEPVGGELADRLEHRDARLAARRVHPAEEALLDEAGEPVEDVDGLAVDRTDVVDHGLDRASPPHPRTPPAARTGAVHRATSSS